MPSYPRERTVAGLYDELGIKSGSKKGKGCNVMFQTSVAINREKAKKVILYLEKEGISFYKFAQQAIEEKMAQVIREGGVIR